MKINLNIKKNRIVEYRVVTSFPALVLSIEMPLNLMAHITIDVVIMPCFALTLGLTALSQKRADQCLKA